VNLPPAGDRSDTRPRHKATTLSFMLDMEIIRDHGRALLRLRGTIGEGDPDLVREAFAFVQPSDHLVLDLTAVEAIDGLNASTLYEAIRCRFVQSETIVVSDREGVSMALVLHDIDRVASIVPSVEQAVGILDFRRAGHSQWTELSMVAEQVGGR